ncbi:histidine kinase [Pseudoxanthomonas sp. Root630]|uniref:histidine kinase n=1 Tax=Pseudoxanthomonas sp. Root630 TaxID=1736574 RepID=UPI00070383DA|nr:histidine kinase [Pseudoxanthomonas sp. Root630]KRA46302.1 hypothetical protein ASD72_03550 [Pseudoxanthomonas sp. Root630]
MRTNGTLLPRDLVESHRVVSRLVAMAAAAAVAQLISIELWIPAPRDHMLWLPGAVLMSALLWRPYSEWLACMLGAFAGCVGTLVVFGAPPAEVGGVIMGLMVLVGLASWLLRQIRRPVSALEDYPQVALFLVIAVLFLPLASACWTWVLTRSSTLPDFVGSWHNLLLANSLSYLLLVPTVAALRRIRRHPERRPARSPTQIVLALTMLLVLWAIWARPWSSPVMEPLLTLAASMLLVWLLLVFGAAGAFLALLCSTLLCMAISSRGLGPFALDSIEQTTLAVQLWALGDGIMLLLLTVLAEQRQTARISLSGAYLRLADLTGRMLRVQEEERTRIARDLHDDINQSLASISIQLSSLKRNTASAAKEQIEKLQEQLLAVSGDVRRLSHDLHPSLLRYTSLAAALRGLCDTYHSSPGTRLHCEIADDVNLDDDQKLNLFRIAQEALHNINRHAHARHAWVRLAVSEAEGLLQVDDDGVGVDVAEAGARRGLGMISIEERARLLGGRSVLERRSEGGSRLEVRFPMRRPDVLAPPSVSS